MKFKNEKKTFPLNGTGIDYCSDFLEEMLEQSGVERRNRLRIRLTIEELLLRFREHFGEDHEFQASLSRKFGTPGLSIELEGTNYNPLAKQENRQDDWDSSILSTLGIQPQFVYIGNRNVIRIAITPKRMNPILKLLIAMAIAVIGGLLIRNFLPGFAAGISGSDTTPVYDLWTRILNLISGPVIFSMVVTTMLGLRRLSVKGASSKTIVGRYFVISALIAVFTVIITSTALHMTVSRQPFDNVTVTSVLNFIFQIVPSEVVSPFMEANTPQLIFLAVMVGTLLNVLRDQVPYLIRLVNQFNTVCLVTTEWISYLVPIFTCLLIGQEIAGGHLGLFLRLWMPLAIAIGLTVLIMIIFVLRLSLTMHVPVRTIVSKVKRPFLTALQKGSLSASYGETEYSCTRQMGIDRDLTEVSLSNGIVLYMPASILGAIVFVIWAAATYQIEVTWLWYVIAALFAAILMEAAPPVPGVSLLVYIVIFKMLNIPDDALIPAMIFDIIFGILASAANQLMLQLEMVHQANRMGLINRDILNTPMEKG